MKENKIFNRLMVLGVAIVLFTTALSGCTLNTDTTDYSVVDNWAYYEANDEGTKADVFFVCPTVLLDGGDSYNMSLEDEGTKADFLGAINMEKGIYDDETRFFAPYYRQASLAAYELGEGTEQYLEFAYEDVKAAFEYYIKNENEGNPIVLAGFSQGADMCIRLLKDCFRDEDVNKLLVACYAIGWRVTEEDIIKNPHLKPAEGENDTGVIVSFNSEAEEITDSLIIPHGIKSLAINPLNWKTDSTPADKSLNKGACFTDYNGNTVNRVENLTGAYIDAERGSLRITDITPEEYRAVLPIFKDGIYHLYDYQFFYQNLQDNVGVRIDSYLKK